jgi:metal-responsive CopG/Arc/MetJ family transcriptional regulator
MFRASTITRRVKVGVTVDRELLGQVDAFVATHPEADRSKIFNEALYLWYAAISRNRWTCCNSPRSGPSTRRRK